MCSERMLAHKDAAMTLNDHPSLLGDDLDVVSDRLDEAWQKSLAA